MCAPLRACVCVFACAPVCVRMRVTQVAVREKNIYGNDSRQRLNQPIDRETDCL